jgi:arginyl-tRNA synthetase
VAMIAEAVGIGAVKYADLSTERLRDYVFDWDRMLAFEGNTGPYLIYAHARICSILRRAEAAVVAPQAIDLEPGPERDLAMALAGFPEALATATEDYLPSKLCAYLFDLAQRFTTFYEHCPVLRAPTTEDRDRRLLLCDLVRRTMSLGLSLLGIEALEEM